MTTRRGELVATDESSMVAEPLFDPIVVENSQGNRSLADSAGTNECNWNDILGEIDDLFDQLVSSKEDPRGWRRGFSRDAR